MSHRRRVLLPPSEWEPFSQLRRGVLRYVYDHANWIIEVLPPELPGVLPQLARWRGDGAILLIRTPADLRRAKKLPFPVVNASAFLPDSDVPRVRPDDRAVGRIAAEHLLERGLRRFAFYGRRGPFNIELREKGFRERLVEAGFSCASCEAPFPCTSWALWRRIEAGIERFLRQLRPPCGVLGCSDTYARLVIDACHRSGLRVPADVAVMGVDNAEQVCAFSDPPMTSVDRNMERVGFEAAAHLERLMSGRARPSGDIVIPPGPLVKRRSTDTIGAEEPNVRVVAEYIRDHLGEVFGVERLVMLVPVSRRWLERSFRMELGRSMHRYLCEARVGRAKELLTSVPKLKLREVARACGFSNAKRLRLVFERVTGTSLGQYRRSAAHATSSESV